MSPEDKEWVNRFGGYNDFPPNWEEISDQDFYRKWFVYGWKIHDTRQMMRPSEIHQAFYDKLDIPSHHRPIIQATLFFYSDTTGLAITQGYDGKYNPRYFQFGLCMHKNKSGVPSKSRMCYHVSKCDDCGMEFHVDSSD